MKRNPTTIRDLACSRAGALFSITLLLHCSPLRATQVFSDRATFLASISNENVIDFEDVPVAADGSVPVIGDPWLPLGIVFDELGRGDNMAVGGGGGADKNIFALGGPAADIEITLTHPVLAFGLGIFSNNQQSPAERILFYTSDNALIADIEMPLTTASGTSFVGVLADSPSIKRIVFSEDDDADFVGIGDVAFTPVPEPSTTMLTLSAGLAIVAFTKQTRHSVRQMSPQRHARKVTRAQG
jgi:hypothetical protein